MDAAARRLVLASALALAVGVFAGLATPRTRAPVAPPATPALAAGTIDEVAASYVKLALAVGRFDADYVDAYFGPAALREESLRIPRAAIVPEGRRLHAALDALPEPAGDRLEALRRASLLAHLDALVAVMERHDGRTLPFAEEVAVVYGLEPPAFDEAENAAVLAELDRLLPGQGDLAPRYAAWVARYTLPADRWDPLLRASLAESRRRTQAFVALPPEERVEIEYVTGEPWAAFNRYRGDFLSVVQVNRGARMEVGNALVFACHEAYPGHHVLNVVQERDLVDGRGWVELSVNPLYSPSSVIAEGTACQAVAVTFPGDERDAFLAGTLFPLAGLPPEDAAAYARICDLAARLDDAQTEATRRLLSPGGDRRRVAAWLARHSCLSPGDAWGSQSFALRYGSYVVTYSVGSDLVRAWLDANAREGGPDRQTLFARLLGEPCLPRDLRVGAPR